MWICPKCQAEVDDELVSCWKCSSPLEDGTKTDSCPKCQAPLAAGGAFCTECGESLAEPAPAPDAEAHSGSAVLVRKRVGPAPLDLGMEPAVVIETGNSSDIMAAPAAMAAVATTVVTGNPLPDSEVFASQFPQWDLMPPATVVRRIRRSL